MGDVFILFRETDHEKGLQKLKTSFQGQSMSSATILHR